MKNLKYVAIIQAGGKGTRLFLLTQDKMPKPMLPLAGKPMIEWQIESLREHGIQDFIIVIGHLGNQIREYFGDGQQMGVHIGYIEEIEPLGSAGALYYVKCLFQQQKTLAMDVRDTEIRYILIFGDIMFDLDWERFFLFHEEKKAMLTLLAHPNSHPYDSDIINVQPNQRVVGILKKNRERLSDYENLVNAGIYIFNEKVLDAIEKPVKTDFEENVIIPMLAGKDEVYAYITPEYVKDAGTPERFREVEKAKIAGVWHQKNLQQPQKCIFLDRDGTINRFKGLLTNPDDLELEEGAAEAIKRINASGYLTIIVTNQPVVARGMCNMERVYEIHRRLVTMLGQIGAYVDDIFFCPHHPDKGYPEENPLYKVKCRCRKPDTGMIMAAADKFHIDLQQSYLIGDTTCDIQTGINAGLHTILLRTGEAGMDRKYAAVPEMVCRNLLEAVDRIGIS